MGKHKRTYLSAPKNLNKMKVYYIYQLYVINTLISHRLAASLVDAPKCLEITGAFAVNFKIILIF